jgi:HAD superfamily hydrolase (TIGR01509 family)
MLAPADGCPRHVAYLRGVNPSENHRIDAVLLDLYDTVAWVPRAVLLRERLAGRVGVEPEALREAWATTYRARTIGELESLEAEIAAILEACGVAAESELVSELAVMEWGTWREVELFDDALPFMARQRALGRSVAIVSNCSRQTQEVVRVHGLEEAADLVILSCDVGVAKPDAGIFEAALEGLGVEPHRAVFVDDVPAYLDGAAALGIKTAHIAREGIEVADTDHHRRIGSLTELDAVLGPVG